MDTVSDKQFKSFEEVGRSYIFNLIESLEESTPGLDPTFYLTGSYEQDINQATQLREAYGMPRPQEVKDLLDRNEVIIKKQNDYFDSIRHKPKPSSFKEKATNWFLNILKSGK
jgi:hypothetical protein